MIIAGAQVREARGLLGWSLMTLANKSPVGETTIRNIETGKRRPTPFKVLEIRRILEAAGIEFDDTGHGGRIREGKWKRDSDALEATT
jgi:transcriptional regulator with XRE-family HTH domain